MACEGAPLAWPDPGSVPDEAVVTEALTEAIGELPVAVLQVDCSEPPCLVVFEGLAQEDVERVVATYLGAPEVALRPWTVSYPDQPPRWIVPLVRWPLDTEAQHRLSQRSGELASQLTEEAAGEAAP